MRDIERYEAEYLRTDFEQMYQVSYRRKKVLEILNKNKHNRILEIGCGMQTIASFIPDFDEFTIVEPGTVFLEKAKEDLKVRRGVVYVHGFAEEQTEILKTREYDFIIVSSLLHELESPITLLKALRKLCTKKTIVHVNVPNEMSLHRMLAYESGFIDNLGEKSERNISLQQNNIYNLDTLEKLIQDSGNVCICDKGSYFIKPFTHRQMEQCLDNGILNSKVLDGLYKLVKYMPEYGSEIYVNYHCL